MFCRCTQDVWLVHIMAPSPGAFIGHITHQTLRTFICLHWAATVYLSGVDTHKGKPRSARLCPQCSTYFVGDYHHLIFTCQAVEPIRRQFPQLFQIDLRGVLHFTWQPELVGVATLVMLALEAYHPESRRSVEAALVPCLRLWARILPLLSFPEFLSFHLQP